jgi:hypothetical protein
MMKRRGRVRGWVALVAAGALAFAAVLGGTVLCFCNDDPDDCGEVCHDCCTGDDGTHEEEACDHLVVATPDLQVTSSFVPMSGPVAEIGRFVYPKPVVCPPIARPPARAAAPPDQQADSALFRVKSILLRS